MQNLTFFAIMANSDTTEGRGPMFFTGVGFKHKSDAISFARGTIYANLWGVMGTPGDQYCVKEMTVTMYDTLKECEDRIPEKLKEDRRLAALRKLSAEDREALGL